MATLPQAYSEPPKSPAPKTRDRVAAVLQVSPRKVQDAITLFKRDPELLGAVRDGKIALSAARKIADIGDQPAREKAKADALAGDKKAVRQAVKEAPARVTARKKVPGLNVDSVLTRLAAMRRETMGAWPWRGDATAVVAVLREWADEIEGGVL